MLIDTTLGEPMVLAVPNNGVERKKYGLLYSSPQRVLKRQWTASHDGFVGPTASAPAYGTRPGILIWMQIQVDERGKVRDFRVNSLTKVPSKTLEHYERAARATQFLPGYHEGRPTPMLYAEPIFSAN